MSVASSALFDDAIMSMRSVQASCRSFICTVVCNVLAISKISPSRMRGYYCQPFAFVQIVCSLFAELELERPLEYLEVKQREKNGS